MKRFRVPLILLAMTIGVLWKQVLTNQYTYLDSPDLANQVAPWLQAQASAWQHGNFPLLWDPYIAGGQSLIGQAQPGTAFPLNWILFLMPLHKGFIQRGFLQWYMVLVHFFAALACYALCRDLNRSRAASILGAAAYSFGGYVATTWWPQQVQACIFAPLAVLFSLRAIRGERPWVSTFFSGFFMGLMWLGGHHQVPIFTLLGIGGIWLFHVAKGKTARVKIDRLVLLGALAAAMVVTGAVQLFPSYSYGLDSVRWVSASHEVHWNEAVPYSVHEEFSQPSSSILGIFMDGIFHHANPFLGFTVFLLAIVAVAAAWDEMAVRLLAFMALGAMLLSFGGQTIVHSILYAVVPMVEKARSPAVAVFVVQLGLCPLAAFGLDRVLENPRAQSAKVAGIASAAMGLLLYFLAVHVEVNRPQIDWHLYTAPVTALAAVLLAVLIFALRNGKVEPGHAGVWAVVLVMLEIGNLSGMGMTNRDQGWKFWPLLERDRDIALFLKAQPGTFRIASNNDDISYNFADWYGIEALIGYSASLMDPFVRIFNETSSQRLLGISYYLSKTPKDPSQRVLMTGASGIKVFEVRGAMPRTWAVHEATQYTGTDPAAKLNALDLEHSTIVPNPAPRLETCGDDQVKLTRHKAQSAFIDAQMNCRGMVILADAYSKDWVATVDGQRTPIYPAYTFLRGVVVESGRHHIEFRYRPWSVYWGAILTFTGFGAALWIWLRQRRGVKERIV